MKNILIVEDSATYRELLCKVLKGKGYKVKGVGSVKSALDEIKKDIYDFICSPYLWLSLRTPPVRPALCVQSVHFQSKFFWIVHNIVCAVYLVLLPIGKAKCRVAGFSAFLVLVDRNRKCVGNLNIITETDTVKRVVPAFFKYLFRTFLLIGHDQSVEYDRHP